ncbi:alpha/beta hydrolase [Sphingomonas oleivorans]|uniref:Alpha/beta hydrolase n=2 Tax=Sphingomonas oleivorans TaxID=1735121 RepID=A0A2T5G353_9SPHN|nr:alpha/beta hydrolase [Sphingomonas oleivorans]
MEKQTARTVPTRFIETNGRTLAYRMFGDGPPLILCLRLRGVMDVWDPAFLDALAENFTVIIFDYSGLGQSTGTATYDRASLARDAKDLIDALGIDKVVIGGWSLGGVAAQIFTALYPERTSHAILIGTVPPGEQPHGAEPIFLPTALKPDYTLEDEYILFFEPESAKSRAAADASHARIASRTADRSPPVPEETYLRIVRESHDPKAVFPDHSGRYAELLANGAVPLLAICGDHDVVFPVENWYALNREWTSLHIMTFPQAGHGPQHQHPELCADMIASFVRNTA